MISRESLAMASYSGPRAAKAATLRSTVADTDATAAASAGAGRSGDLTGTVGDTGAVAGREAAAGVGATTGGAGGGGGASRGTTGREMAAGAAGPSVGGNGVDALTVTGPSSGGEMVASTGCEGTTDIGAAGVRRCGAGGEDTAGLLATVGLAEGKPIMVRFMGGRANAGAGGDDVGCGVKPERTAGRLADGRAPGISDGRGELGATAGGRGLAAGMGRAPEGRVGGFAAHVEAAVGGAGLRSMVISP